MASHREASRFDTLAELGCVSLELVKELGGLLEHFEDLDAGSGDRWCDRVREQVRSALVAEQVDHFLGGSRVAARSAAESLAQRRANHVDLAFQTE